MCGSVAYSVCHMREEKKKRHRHSLISCRITRCEHFMLVPERGAACLAGSLWKVHRQRKPLAGRCHNISIRQIYGRSFAGGMTPRGPRCTFFLPRSCHVLPAQEAPLALSLSFYVCRHPPFDERRAGHLLTHCPALYFSPGGEGRSAAVDTMFKPE